MKDRIIGTIIGLAFISLGVSMWLWAGPEAADAGEAARGRTRLVLSLLEWIWSRPAGVVAAVLGVLVIFGSFVKPESSELSDAAF